MSNLAEQLSLSRLTRPVSELVENRTLFESHGADFSIYDTYQSANSVRLDAEELLYCGMISGKKVLHGDHLSGKHFLPMESFVMSPGQTVAIDFPEAEISNPTTCIAISIDRQRLQQTCHQLNYDAIPQGMEDWEQLDLSYLHCMHSMATQSLLSRIATSFTDHDKDRDLVLDLGITELLARLIRHQGKQFLLKAAHDDPTKNALSAVIHFIEAHLAEPLEIDTLCQVACMSRSKLYSEFSKAMHCSPREYIQLRRLEKACELLEAGEPITKVCYDVGYSNPSHFARRFQQRYGQTPRQYQTQLHQTY